MAKLQRIQRSDGSESYSSNLPIAIIKDLGWKKADKLSLEIGKVRDRNVIIIFNEEDEDGGN